MSLFFARAAEQYKALRLEYQDVLEAKYRAAETATRGELLNRRGEKAGVDAFSLFLGPAVRAYAYASDELVEHWARFPRLTYTDFERQMLEQEWRSE